MDPGISVISRMLILRLTAGFALHVVAASAAAATPSAPLVAAVTDIEEGMMEALEVPEGEPLTADRELLA